jgi:hypothetical protein
VVLAKVRASMPASLIALNAAGGAKLTMVRSGDRTTGVRRVVEQRRGPVGDVLVPGEREGDVRASGPSTGKGYRRLHAGVVAL